MKMSLEHGTMDATLAAIGSKTTYTAAGATTVSWVFSSEFGIAAGVLIGILGFALNWYYSRKRDQREQIAHDMLMSLEDENETKAMAKLMRDSF